MTVAVDSQRVMRMPALQEPPFLQSVIHTNTTRKASDSWDRKSKKAVSSIRGYTLRCELVIIELPKHVLKEETLAPKSLGDCVEYEHGESN